MDPEEQPPHDFETIECPICKRTFEYTVFTDQHNTKNLCRRVFMQKRAVFDSQKQRVGFDPEMHNMLQHAKQTINFMRRNNLNSSWKATREQFYKYASLHRLRSKGKTIDKMRGPFYVPDPDSPDFVGQT